MMEQLIIPEKSSLLIRARELNLTRHTRRRKAGAAMPTYRVILQIDVDADDIIKSRGKETLRELKQEGGDYLRAHVENEMGWLEESFSHVEIESVTRVKKSKSKK